MRHPRTAALFVALAAAAGTAAHAQPGDLRQPSRTVAGKVTYSDEPCAGAVRVDVEPPGA
jgi:hypothetical protein